MVTITSSVSGTSVTFQISYSALDVGLPETWGVYVYGKINRNLGSGPDPNYPYYVEEFHGTGSSTVTRTELPDSYVAVLALTGYGQVDYTLFVVTSCQPPNGVQRYCGTDGKTLYVWNTVTCSYDSQICQSPNTSCQNGFCVAPACQPPNNIQRYCGTDGKTLYVWNSSTCQYDSSVCSTNLCQSGFCVASTCQPPNNVQRYCDVDGKTVCVWNQVDCKYNCSICSTNVCQNGMCATPGGGTGYNCSGSPNYQCIQAPSGTTGQYSTSDLCTAACRAVPATGGCNPACTSTQMCIAGSCVPKNYVLIGVIGFFALMMLRR